MENGRKMEAIIYELNFFVICGIYNEEIRVGGQNILRM